MRIGTATLLVAFSLISCDSPGSSPPPDGTTPAADSAAGDTGGADTAGGDALDCEILVDPATGQNVSCMGATPAEEVPCPEGYQCSGLSAFWCYKGSECNLPICLAAQARIATPRGPIPVSQLRVGDPVWTLGAEGRRVVAPIAELGRVRAPVEHRMVRLVLSDGRTLRASPGHPLAGGSTLGELQVAASYDGATVVTAQLEPYAGGHTWDLLPAGETGLYWAEGVILGSTLAP